MKINNLITRSLAGAGFVIIILGGILLGSISYFILFLTILIASLIEFYLIIKKHRENNPQIFLGVTTSIIAFTLTFFNAIGYIPNKLVLLVVPFASFIFINEVLTYSRKSLSNIAYTVLGLFYVTVPFSLLNYLVFQSNGTTGSALTNKVPFYTDEFLFSLKPSSEIFYHPEFLISIFVLIWIFDSFSYLWGVTTGRHLLIPKISPKKTWEGFWGGALSTILSSYIIAHYFNFFSTTQWLVLSLIVIFFGTFGDLTESLIKRSLHIKDSGNIIPGHGGLLDRFDSFIMITPVYYFFLAISM
jgi:phosphatidate cytidylyltransferase